MILHLVLKSIFNRKFTVGLTALSIALSVSLLLSVERIRIGTREGFTNTITGTDLIVGAKGSPTNLLLYSIFHLGTPMENISWRSFQDISRRQDIAWSVPISLGDSHRSFRVVGTSQTFFKYYKYGASKALEFDQGHSFASPFEAVLGASVAAELGYQLETPLVLSHGAGDGAAFYKHEDSPFKAVGILKRTGTPIDRSIFVSLQGIEAIHEGWEDGAPGTKKKEHVEHNNYAIKEITAFLLRTESRIGTLHLQRAINEYADEPLLAIIPGVTLSELWLTLGYVEKSLAVISLLVVAIGMIGMLISIYNSLNERRREIAILRSLGASPADIFLTLMFESFIIALAGTALGLLFTHIGLQVGADWLQKEFSVNMDLPWMTKIEAWYLLGVLGLSLILGIIPAIRAYSQTLTDGLTIKV